jgi:integrase/recombinase XerD
LSRTLSRRYSGSAIFGALVSDFGAWLHGHEYARTTIINLCRHISHLERWLRARYRVSSASAITPAMLVAADVHFRPLKNAYRHFTCVALHRFLRQRQLIPDPKPIKPSPSQKEVGCYEAYLRDVRGLSVSTVKDRCHRAASFLDYVRFDRERQALSRLKLGRIERFIKREATKNGRSGLRQVTSGLRGFLRFEFQAGRLPHPLHEHIEAPLLYADEKLPPVLTRDQVQTLLRSIDQKSPHGLRDFAMIYLIAAYGLRSSEVVALKLDDINWRSGILRIKQAKTKREIALPLTNDAGRVLVRYFRRGRPRTRRRDLFLKSVAPMGPYSPKSLRDILHRRLRKGGLDFGRFGLHAMRHSLAVHLLRRGVSMKSIGDTLGHRSIKSTATYLRLNLDDLRAVGLPVPPVANAEPLLASSWRDNAPKDPNEKRGGGLRPRAKKRCRSVSAQEIERFLATSAPAIAPRHRKPHRIVARLPVPRPLLASIAAGHFGQEDDGKPVRPGVEEVRAITERHAEKLIELLDTLPHAQTADRDRLQAAFRAALGSYSEDFGQHAADQLEAYARRQAGLDPTSRHER